MTGTDNTADRSSSVAARSWAIRASTAVYGFALAVALAPMLRIRARPSDLLSALRAEGYSPKGPVLQFLIAVALTAIFAILGDRIARLLSQIQWASVSYCAAVLLAPVTLMYYGNIRHVALVGVAAAAIVALRKRDPHFVRGDAVLVPAFLSCYIAFLDLGFGHTPVATATRAAIAVFAIRLVVRSSDAFVASPLALVLQLGWLAPAASGAVALVVIFGAPFLLVRIKQPLPRRIVYPIVVFLYPLAVLETRPPFSFNVFEDSHSLPVATEMLRSERPYTDIIPTHGIISDGLVDLVGLELGHGSLRTVLVTRLVVGVLSSLAIYCLVLAATGSIEMGLLAAFLAFSLASGSALWLRPSGAMFALAATIAGTRLRSRRWFVVAGALVVVAYLLSVDFGLYSAIVAIFAAFRSRALGALALGVAAAALPSLAIFAVFGFAFDFIRVNLVEILGSHGVYFVRQLTIPECLQSPAVLHHIGSEESIYAFTWIIALIVSSAALARSPLRSRRSDGPWLIGVWMVVAAASFVERGNAHFYPAVVPFLAAALWSLRRRAPTVTVVLTVMVVLLAQPFRHVITVVPELREARPMPLFDAAADTSIRAARRFAATLKPADTFVDFANSALLYSLLARDCPLPQVEVANYQAEDAQREVIRRIERNPHVRAALIRFPASLQSVDGIPNADRAPMVWAYLQKNFTPAFDQDGVVFWRRVR